METLLTFAFGAYFGLVLSKLGITPEMACAPVREFLRKTANLFRARQNRRRKTRHPYYEA